MNNGTINDDLSLGRNPFGFDLNESFDYDYFGGATTRGVNRRGGRTRARIFVFGLANIKREQRFNHDEEKGCRSRTSDQRKASEKGKRVRDESAQHLHLAHTILLSARYRMRMQPLSIKQIIPMIEHFLE